ncbi:hypothetical protein HY745_04485 [Candidatus Desantisbacteria bacterium]|nr:hypothetical protein [Candidatus Desantisbacteria bacterium]
MENLETHQYAVITKAFNDLKLEKYAGDWKIKAATAIEPHLQNILDKAFDFLEKKYYDYSLDMFKLIIDNYPDNILIAKAKEGVFKVNLNKPASAKTIVVSPLQAEPEKQ